MKKNEYEVNVQTIDTENDKTNQRSSHTKLIPANCNNYIKSII